MPASISSQHLESDSRPFGNPQDDSIRSQNALSFDVVDVTEVKIAHQQKGESKLSLPLVISPSLIAPQQFLQSGLLDRAVRLNKKECKRYVKLWRRLREQNAPLRITDGAKLTSAPIDYFDGLILSCATGDWVRFYRLVGEVLGALFESDLYQGGGDALLVSRILALVQSGRLEVRGDTKNVRTRRECEIRLAG
jgi:hypothetical protein